MNTYNRASLVLARTINKRGKVPKLRNVCDKYGWPCVS